jgi:glycosyltransferase involved in cell wall biosynthesis
MLRGEAGYQLKDIRKLTAFLRTAEPPDIATLPNSLLIGLARPIRDALGRPVACTLQGEELFLDQLQEPYRSQALELIRAKVEDVDGFVAVSEFCADYWQGKLGIPDRKLHVVPLGIDADGYGPPARVPGGRFQVGFFARVAPEKGLHLLAESYLRLRRESDFAGSALEVAGYLAPEHRAYLHRVERLMRNAGLAREFHYRGELDRAGKTEFLRSLNVLSVPSTYDEPKGIFLLEAMASGVPVVQPRRGTFREILERPGGGVMVHLRSMEESRTGCGTGPPGRRGRSPVLQRLAHGCARARSIPGHRPCLRSRMSPSSIRRRAALSPCSRASRSG